MMDFASRKGALIMRRRAWRRSAVCFILGTFVGARAQAKVAFSGYADFQAVPQGAFKIDGPPSVLSSFGLGPERIESRGAAIDSIGLFATTSLDDNTRMMLDVTYRDVGV